MPTFNFIIAVVTEPEAHRKDEGDIIAITPGDAEVGRKTLEDHFVVPVEVTKLDLAELREHFMVALYIDGSKRNVNWRNLDYHEDGVDQGLYPYHEYVMSLDFPGLVILQPERISKNRYRIPLSVLGDVDLVKLQDKNTIYQPFLMESRVVAQYTDNDADYEAEYDLADDFYKIEKKAKARDTIIPLGVKYKCHMTTPTIGRDGEKKLKFKKGDDVIQDKFDNSFVEPKDD